MRNNSPEELAAVVADIYEAGYDQDRWMNAMKSVCDLFDGSRACIVRGGANRDEGAAVGSYKDVEFETQDWRILGAAALLHGMLTRPVGDCYRRGEIVNEGAFRKSPLWLEYFRPRGMDDSLSCNLLRGDGSIWTVDISRAAHQGAFERQDVARLATLTPHLLRAGQIGNTLQGVSILSSLYADLPFGMLIVDRQRRVYHLNRVAERILSSGGKPLTERNGRLFMASASDAARLEKLVASACGEDSAGLPGAGGTAIFPRHDEDLGQARLLISVAPLSNTLSYGLPARRNAAIMIREIGREANPGLVKTLPRLFGLTPAEARVAAGLAEGKVLKDIAIENAITVKTARSYLEKVFRKTGTHRQSELVSLIKTTQPWLL